MLVLQSTYDAKAEELARVQQEQLRLQDEISQLLRENDELRNELAASSQPTGSSNELASNMSDALSQVAPIRETVLHSYQNIDQQSHNLDGVQDAFTESSSALTKIVGDMEGLKSKMATMSESISGLSETADNINKFVSTITSISDQTNLLALNAAIEAARAGDAGRGFSVVADEVRALANETNKSASEVAELVQSIIQSTRTAVGSVSELQENNAELSDGVSSLNSNYDHIVSQFGDMSETIRSSSQAAFIQTVKLDHVVWKGEVYQVMAGKSHKQAGDFTDHRSSRLSEWKQNSQAQSGYSDVATRIDAPHAKVHESGIQAVAAFYAGNEDEANRLLADMERASEQVMHLLDSL